MKNIFRKAVQKVRNTTAKVFNTIRENPTLGGTIYKILKTDEEVNISNDPAGATALNAEVALTVFKHVQEAFKTALENGDIDDENRLYNDASGMLNISYTPDRKDLDTYYMGRRESEKEVPNPKTDKEVFGPIGYDADSLVNTFQHVYDAFKAGCEASEESPCVAVNLGEHGVTPFDADTLDLLGLRKKGERLVKLFYWSEDKNAVFGTRS